MDDDAPITAGTNILEYRRGEPAESVLCRRWVRVILFVISLGAAVSPFLPFAYGYSPESVVEEWVTQQHEGTLAMIGFPFFAGVVAAMWKLRLTFDKLPLRAERFIAFALSGTFVTATGAFTLQNLAQYLKLTEWLQMLVAVGIIAVGVGVVAWLGVKNRKSEAVTAAIYFAYAGNAVMCLLIFAGSGEPGWWVTLGVVAAMGVEMVITILQTALGR
jgi:hypothetical protein